MKTERELLKDIKETLVYIILYIIIFGLTIVEILFEIAKNIMHLV